MLDEQTDPNDPTMPTWNTEELRRDFTVVGFSAPYVVVTRKADGVVGSLEFQANPRVYHTFRADS